MNSARVSPFATGALAGALVATGAIYYWQHSGKWWKEKAAETDALRQSNGLSTPTMQSSTTKSTLDIKEALEDEILAEQFTRNVQFFGQAGQQRIFDAFVIVVGLGVRAFL